MNALKKAVVLTSALALGGTALIARADSIQSLNPTPLSSAQFDSMFKPVATAPAMSSAFEFQGDQVPGPSGSPVSGPSGVVESQVFQSTTNPNLYAYAYQVDVNAGSLNSAGDPSHVDSLSFHFGGTSTVGTGSYAYLVQGPIGGLSQPQTPGTPTAGPVPVELSLSNGGKSADVRARFEDSSTGAPPLTAGQNSGTLVLLSTAPPTTQQFVNLQSADPQTSVSGNYTVVYAPNGGQLQPVPAPEPATLLAWAGMAGAIALVRRVRKSRAQAL